jgi:hypothetical protein
VEIISSKTALTVGKGIFSSLKSAYQARQTKRVESFFHCVELRYDYMNESERIELNEKLNSDEGESILASYVDAITQTSCDRVRMAVAMLYCNDPDFLFTTAEQRLFINSVVGITDRLVDFFLMASTIKAIPGNYPYSRHLISKEQLPYLSIENLDGEEIYSYINELIRRGLLLPEPATGVLGSDNSWAVGFGTSARTQRFASLLRKAGQLL